jgi:hypothetical protein
MICICFDSVCNDYIIQDCSLEYDTSLHHMFSICCNIVHHKHLTKHIHIPDQFIQKNNSRFGKHTLRFDMTTSSIIATKGAILLST